MKKARKIFSTAMCIISAVIFICGFAVFIASVSASSGKVPTLFGYSVLQVQTGSMEPEIETGSIIIVKKVEFDSLEIGDIISFYSTDDDIYGKVNTHRINDFVTNFNGKEIIVTKGDANTSIDASPVYSSDIIGRLCLNLGTVSGSVLGVLKNPRIIFIFIILPLIFITFSEAVHLVTLVVENKLEKQKEENNEKSQEKKN